ncbi:galactose-binding like protein [Basidiobolus meristosporus CBS 931.73]|uniref:Nuclear receptor 2C2-associated protein n=1 Tax=Basidiobolus meristosporus CBS 931.73 TaxID=1314790 RepID=A0A1Y1YBE9_9FUNG|nr:galactose-binding like protein [Basidiobolus meristosporus CBS 931.73]|eukprot:ORX95329.1 galactose-binding like protein [Basidiobolus meristosporus CBS 931.73]
MNLLSPTTRIKVSSTLNKDVTNFGKQFLVDGDDETCWNSEQGSPQYILIDLQTPTSVQGLRIMFQGGFVGKECQALGAVEGNDYISLGRFYPEDNNDVQEFSLEDQTPVKKLKLVFESSTDFFGRITIYRLEVIGEKK